MLKNTKFFLLMVALLFLGHFSIAQSPDLPIDFENTGISYNPNGFGDANFGPIPTEIIANPDASGENTSATVWHINKPEAAQVWAGASIQLQNPIDFTASSSISMKIWSPVFGRTIRLKLEDTTSPLDANGNPTVFAEVDLDALAQMSWQTLTWDMTSDSNFSPDSSYNRIVVFPHFGLMGATGGESYYFDDIEVYSPPPSPADIPLDFEATNTAYNPSGFGDANFGPIPTEIISNPDASGQNTSGTVWHINKPEGAQVWAGAAIGIQNPIVFAASNIISMKVWSPTAGRQVRLKIEDTTSPPDGNGNPTVFAEVDATTTAAMAWETLTFDMTTGAGGFSPDSMYNNVVVFPHFGSMGEVGGESYYFDDIEVYNPPAIAPTLPMDFESTSLTYSPAGFGDANFGPIPTEIIANPDASAENTSSTVWHINKPEGAQVWAGAAIGLSNPIDFSASNIISMKVWSPTAGRQIRLKIEDTTSPPDGNGNPTVFAEVDATTTAAMAWETLTFDMTTGAGDFSPDSMYNNVVVFPHFGSMGEVGGESYYFDDFEVYNPPAIAPTLPMDFESTSLTYSPAGFGDANFGPIPTEIIANPDASAENTSSTVWHINKPEGAQVWAGAAIGLSNPIDFSASNIISMKVWSPVVGRTIRLKIEDTTSPPDANGNPTVFTEVDATTTSAMTWETLTFDMTTGAGGFSPDSMYNNVVVFPHFGSMGEIGGESYYFDDIEVFIPPVVRPSLPIDFEDSNITYTLFGFGDPNFGPIPTEVTANPDPTGDNTSATVWHINKPEGSQTWAGVAVPLENIVDLSNGSLFSIKVWSPNSGTPILFKFEDTTSPPDPNGNPSIITENMLTSTVGGAWETIIFDIADFAGYDPLHQFNQMVVFPDFGNMGAVGDPSYYFDDIEYYTPPIVLPELPLTFEEPGISYQNVGFGLLNSSLVDNPDPSGINTSATVLELAKTFGAGISAGTLLPLAAPIDLGTQGLDLFSMKVWSPRPDVPFLFKFEDTSDPTNIKTEMAVKTSISNGWETLYFNMAEGSNYDPNASYNQIVIFPDFGNTGLGEIFYIDDIMNDFISSVVQLDTESYNFYTFPNPTKDRLKANFDLPETSLVSIELLDVLGRRVDYFYEEKIGSGAHSVDIDLSKVGPGSYWMILSVDGLTIDAKQVIVQ